MKRLIPLLILILSASACTKKSEPPAKEPPKEMKKVILEGHENNCVPLGWKLEGDDNLNKATVTYHSLTNTCYAIIRHKDSMVQHQVYSMTSGTPIIYDSGKIPEAECDNYWLKISYDYQSFIGAQYLVMTIDEEQNICEKNVVNKVTPTLHVYEKYAPHKLVFSKRLDDHEGTKDPFSYVKDKKEYIIVYDHKTGKFSYMAYPGPNWFAIWDEWSRYTDEKNTKALDSVLAQLKIKKKVQDISHAEREFLQYMDVNFNNLFNTKTMKSDGLLWPIFFELRKFTDGSLGQSWSAMEKQLKVKFPKLHQKYKKILD